MKRLLLILTLLLSMLLLDQAISQNLFSQSFELRYLETPNTELEAYVQNISGNWITDTRAYLYDEPEAYENFIRISIDPANIEGDEIKIVVNEYCWPEFAQFLHFKLEDNKLVYTGASINDCKLDYTRIDYIHIYYETVGGEPLLIYEAQEMESQNYIREELIRDEVSLLGRAQIEDGLQNHLLALMKEERYMIYDTLGNWVMPKVLFGSEIELEYLQGPGTIWYQKEDKCTDFEFAVLLLGENNPPGLGDIYGIDWDRNVISLFNTYYADEGSENLQKGELVYTIVLDSEGVFP